MIKNKGFTIIESLIYIICLGLLTLVFVAMADLYINIKTNLCLLRSKLEIFIGCNLLLDSIAKSAELKFFKSVERNNLIYRDSDLDIGWVCKSNNLYRYVGQYCQISKKWIKKRSSLISQNIEYIDFKYNNNMLNAIVTCKNTGKDSKDHHLQVFVSPRIGVEL